MCSAVKPDQCSDEVEEVSRVSLPSEDGELTLEQFHKLWEDQENYINHLENRIRNFRKSTSEEKSRTDCTRRENLLLMRLTAKEQEIQELAAQVAQLKSAQAPTSAALRSTLLDPAINILIQKLTKECENLKKQAEDKQNEMAAWKFTADSASGKRLMAKCRQLYQENEDLGKMISSGRMAKLEGELALQKDLSEKMKQNQLEMDDFMAELDEDVEGMQSTILLLQKQLREAKDTIARLTEGGAGATKTAEDEETTHLVQEQEEKPTADEVEANVEAEEGHGEKRKLAENTEVESEVGFKRTKTEEEEEVAAGENS